MTLIIAGSGMGKTTVANRLAVGAAARGLKVMLHGTETSEEERAEDILFSVARVDPTVWGTACVARERSDRRDRMMAALNAAERWSADNLRTLTISSKGATAQEVAGRAIAKRAQGQLDMLIVDYIQDLEHIHEGGVKRGDMLSQVMHASTTLKGLSARIRVPVVAFAQRSGEKEGPKADPRPQMWDVQWAMRVAQDAEEVFGLYREDYYAERDPKWQRTRPPGELEIVRRKTRRGRLSTALTSFHGPTKWCGEPLAGFECVS
jgi:replicative DNA helicase